MSTIDPNRICVILVEPTRSGNIGATARAMDNMGVSDLRLVNPCEHFNSEARMFSMKGRHLLEKARIFSSLKEAITDRNLIIGTSTRQRDKLNVSSSVYQISEIIMNYALDSSAALIFGTEVSGLSNEDLSYCNELIYIPTYSENSSLNLSQAAMVVLYELSKLFSRDISFKDKPIIPASSKNLEGMKDHFFQLLRKTGFTRSGGERPVRQSFSNLIGRAKPDERDVRMIRGFFNRVEVCLKDKERIREQVSERLK